MSDEPIVIYSAASTQQAHLLKGLLAEQGIAARVVNDAIQMGGGDLPLGWAAAARVVVGARHAASARAIAESFDRQTAHEASEDEPDAFVELAEFDEWPLCPGCGDRRSARCPACGVSRTDFPLADIQDLPEGRRIFFVCADCDDHFLPEWYRFCPRCGHDYGDGIEVQSAVSRREFGPRLAVVIGVLVAGGMVAAAYVLWLFSWRAG